MSLFTKATSHTGFPVLDDLPWRSAPQKALQAASGLLVSDEVPRELIAWLAARTSDELGQITDRSLERPTHFKWFLGGRPADYVIWLHEYKQPEVFAQATSFAASVHNHRYGFCSRVLSGGLHVSTFSPPAGPGGPVLLVERRHVARGQTMILSHEDVHRIDRVEPRTCTILVQGPTARNFSTCYDITTGSSRRLYDMQSRLPWTMATLAAEYVESRPADTTADNRLAHG
ncbi:hypothetical protein ACFYOK_10115 [Microbispora bryophytorum]|uniref:hypothetical protein n=1 Tax=Microbispora bryophytorum TaxID=1460882 RepID=UPI0033CBC90E